ncbi:MAG: histidinol dehydrogenase [Solirubrobacterales bacterium]
MIKRFVGRSAEFMAFLAAAEEDLETLLGQVKAIGDEIKKEGDQAVCALTNRFDQAGITPETLRVTQAEIDRAYELVDQEYLEALDVAIENIAAFHQKQLHTGFMDPDEDGNVLGQVVRPLERVGIYVPGGTAAYPSSVLMNAIPAMVAGVDEIAMVSPPAADGSLNPYTLVAAAELGLEEIYKVGGAQAVFALAFGTESIRKVDKISGPGNIYVTLAKKLVYGEVDIDMLAGPSEILIVADASADPVYLAADMMSQAEHDPRARSILVTPDASLPDQVEAEIIKQMAALSRKSIIETSLTNNGAFVVVDNLEQAFEIANLVAPEHLEVEVEDPFAWVGSVKNAGAIFLGSYTPEPVGDYLAGPNHILPTGGTARFYSPVTVDTFLKKTSLLYYSRTGFARHRDSIIKLAEVEGLTAHANAIKVRKGF